MTNPANFFDGLKTIPSALSTLNGTFAMLDPSTIVLSKYANRTLSSPDDESFMELKQLIKDAGGNVTRIQVRKVVTDRLKPDVFRLEVISGHRTLQACQELNFQVGVLLVDDLSDLELIRHMTLSNAGRKPLSALESGWAYRRYLDDCIFLNQAHLASELGVPTSDVSNSLSFTRFPEIVIKAFGAPNALQYAHAKPLKDALAQDEAGVLGAAKKLARRQAKLTRKLPPKEVLAALVACVAAPLEQAVGDSSATVVDKAMAKSPAVGKEVSVEAGQSPQYSSTVEPDDQPLKSDDEPETIATSSTQSLRRDAGSSTTISVIRSSNKWSVVVGGVVMGYLYVDGRGCIHLELEPFNFTPEDCEWFLCHVRELLERAPWIEGPETRA